MNLLRRILWPRPPRPEPVAHVPNWQHAVAAQHWHMVLAERRANEIAERRHRAGTRVSV